MEQVWFLGHKISKHGVAVDPSKIEVVVDLPQPSNVIEIWSFLGLASHYQTFVENFSNLATSLIKLAEKNEKFVWSL